MPSRTDQIISKSTEKVKAVKATVKGLVGVFKTLMEQHGEVSGLMRRVQNNDDKRSQLWPQIRRELLSHERGEKEVVFSVLREHDRTRPLAERHEQDASMLEAKIEELESEGIGTEVWGKHFDELFTMVREHVADEESEIFPTAQEVLGEERARDLDASFLEAKQAADAELRRAKGVSA